jgi:hypothetical protein
MEDKGSFNPMLTHAKKMISAYEGCPEGFIQLLEAIEIVGMRPWIPVYVFHLKKLVLVEPSACEPILPIQVFKRLTGLNMSTPEFLTGDNPLQRVGRVTHAEIRNNNLFLSLWCENGTFHEVALGEAYFEGPPTP